MKLGLAAFLLFPSLLVGACSSSSDSAPWAGDDAGGADDAAAPGDAEASTPRDAAPAKPDAADAGPSCLDLPRPDPSIAPTTGAGSLPAPVGGFVPHGTYHLTATTLYGGATETIATGGILKIDTGTIETSTATDTGTWRTERRSFAYNVAVEQMELYDCLCATLNGAAAGCVLGDSMGYSSNGTELHLLYPGASGGIERTYVKE